MMWATHCPQSSPVSAVANLIHFSEIFLQIVVCISYEVCVSCCQVQLMQSVPGQDGLCGGEVQADVS